MSKEHKDCASNSKGTNMNVENASKYDGHNSEHTSYQNGAACVVNNKITEETMKGDETEVSENPPIRKLFVGNLTRNTSRYNLRSFFRQFGKIMDCSISHDKKGYRRNYGFVTFKNPDDALRVLSMPQKELQLQWKDIYVAAADSWHQPQETPDGVIWKRKKNLKYFDIRKPIPSTQLLEARLQSEKDVQEDLCRIHILNDDCLMHIFSFLPQQDRVRIERVCRRWQTVSRNTWLLQHHLDFANMFNNQDGIVPSNHILRSLLIRCGPNLSSLDLSYRPHEFDYKALSIIVKLAPNLHRLNLSGLPLTSHSIRRLSQVSQHLQYLNLDGCSGLSDHDLPVLFINSPNLESVVLSHNNQITSRCIRCLSAEKLTELVLDKCNNLCSRFLVRRLSTLTNLKKLSLNSCINLTSSDIVEILQSSSQITHLSLANYFPLIGSSALSSFKLLQDLVSLDLRHNPAVTDQVAEVIAKNCIKLEILNVTGCSVHNMAHRDSVTLTNVGFHWFSTLPHLVELKMSYSAVVSDQALDSLADTKGLKRLVCQGCPSFTDAGCMRIVAVCGELELFDFSGCDHVTNATIETALEAVKERTNNIKLKLIAGGTKVTQVESSHPLLQVCLKDLCVNYLRPDFVDDVYFHSSDSDDGTDNENDNIFLASDCSSYPSDIEWDQYSYCSVEDYEDEFGYSD